MRLRAAQRLQRRHPLQRVPTDVEDDRVPGRGGDLLRVEREAAAPEEGAGVLGRLGHRPGDLLLADDEIEPAPGHQAVVEALVRTDVVVLQVDELQPRRVPGQAVPRPVALQNRQLRDPVELADAAHRVDLEAAEDRLPAGEHVGGLAVDVGTEPVLDVLAGLLEVLHLQLHRGHPTTVAQSHQMLEGRIVRDRPQRRHGPVHRQVRGEPAVLDHREDQGGRSHLQVGGDLAHVRVADDDVQPAVLLRVGVRLVPGVDDGPLQRGLEPHLDLEEVGPLADLEPRLPAVDADPDPPGPADDLTGDEERGEVADDLPERRRPCHQVVLMASVRDALVVGVVLVEVDRLGAGHRQRPAGGLGHHPLPGLVPQHDVARVGDLGRGELRVRMIDIEPRPAGQDDVGQAEIVLVGRGARIDRRLAGQFEAPGVAQR